MVRATVIAAKLGELRERLAQVRAECDSAKTAAALSADRRARDLTAFYLMLAVQACVDVAAHIVADEGWPAARTLSELFVRLAEAGVIEATTAAAMGRAAGLRNVVAHGYAGVDVAMLHAAATGGVDDLTKFATEVARWVSARAAASPA